MCFFRPRRKASLLMEALKNRTITRSMMIASAMIRQSAMGYMPQSPATQREDSSSMNDLSLPPGMFASSTDVFSRFIRFGLGVTPSPTDVGAERAADSTESLSGVSRSVGRTHPRETRKEIRRLEGQRTPDPAVHPL